MYPTYLAGTWILDFQPLQNRQPVDLITVVYADTLHHLHNCNKGKYTLKYINSAYHHYMCCSLTQHVCLFCVTGL